MKLARAAVLAAALFASLVAPAPKAHAVSQGATTFACTAACTATGVFTSTEPVTSVFPFIIFRCLDRGGTHSMSTEVRPARVGPVVAGLYTYSWSATARSPYACIGVAELTVFGASDLFMTDSRVAPFNTRL